jgi:hypothetical protein
MIDCKEKRCKRLLNSDAISIASRPLGNFKIQKYDYFSDWMRTINVNNGCFAATMFSTVTYLDYWLPWHRLTTQRRVEDFFYHGMVKSMDAAMPELHCCPPNRLSPSVVWLGQAEAGTHGDITRKIVWKSSYTAKYWRMRRLLRATTLSLSLSNH